MKIGVLGTGEIAKTVSATLKQLDCAECYAIASRTQERAEQAAKEYGYVKAYGTYEELVADPEVELVYIATPHSRHYEDMKLCIEHKKPVLCEKAFTMNSRQAKEIKELSEKENVFVAEAIWPRYMPSRKLIKETINSGIIGKVTTVTANLSYPISGNPRIIRPELAGGALLDLGVYGLNFAIMHFGEDIERIETGAIFAETGVDASESITLFYKDGRMAVLTHSIYGRSDRRGTFYGEKGYIVVENVNNPESISVFDLSGSLIKEVEIPEQISGYEYEFEECIEKIKNNERESSSMPLANSVFVMEVMDAVREKWGMVYPNEK